MNQTYRDSDGHFISRKQHLLRIARKLKAQQQHRDGGKFARRNVIPSAFLWGVVITLAVWIGLAYFFSF